MKKVSLLLTAIGILGIIFSIGILPSLVETNIKLVQLQIKNSQPIQFIDHPLTTKTNCIPIKKMSSRDSWKDVKEICFTIFADDKYITDEKGYIKISELRLVQ